MNKEHRKSCPTMTKMIHYRSNTLLKYPSHVASIKPVI